MCASVNKYQQIEQCNKKSSQLKENEKKGDFWEWFLWFCFSSSFSLALSLRLCLCLCLFKVNFSFICNDNRIIVWRKKMTQGKAAFAFLFLIIPWCNNVHININKYKVVNKMWFGKKLMKQIKIKTKPNRRPIIKRLCLCICLFFRSFVYLFVDR